MDNSRKKTIYVKKLIVLSTDIKYKTESPIDKTVPLPEKRVFWLTIFRYCLNLSRI